MITLIAAAAILQTQQGHHRWTMSNGSAIELIGVCSLDDGLRSAWDVNGRRDDSLLEGVATALQPMPIQIQFRKKNRLLIFEQQAPPGSWSPPVQAASDGIQRSLFLNQQASRLLAGFAFDKSLTFSACRLSMMLPSATFLRIPLRVGASGKLDSGLVTIESFGPDPTTDEHGKIKPFDINIPLIPTGRKNRIQLAFHGWAQGQSGQAEFLDRDGNFIRVGLTESTGPFALWKMTYSPPDPNELITAPVGTDIDLSKIAFLRISMNSPHQIQFTSIPLDPK